MNKLILTAIALSFALPSGAQESNYAIQRRMEAQTEARLWNNQQPTCTYRGYQPYNSSGIQQPITRAEYPITADQQLQSPYVYNP